MKVKIQKVHENAVLPKYSTEGSSGFDFSALIEQEIILNAHQRVVIPTGLAFEIPQGFELQVRSRSGLAAKEGLMVLNSPGTVDSDYRGEVKVILLNSGSEHIKISPFQRIAQGVICPVIKAEFELCELGSTERGERGFGSTGK